MSHYFLVTQITAGKGRITRGGVGKQTGCTKRPTGKTSMGHSLISNGVIVTGVISGKKNVVLSSQVSKHPAPRLQNDSALDQA